MSSEFNFTKVNNMITIEKNIPLADKNSYQIGGNASFYCDVKNQSDIMDAIEWAISNSKNWLLLGKGSNLLISDKGIDGLVINLTKFNKIEFTGEKVVAEAGALLNDLVFESTERGLAGYEELAGIPGTIGGAVVMNAGAFNACISDRIVSVELYNPDSKLIERKSREEMHFGYRTSIIHNSKYIVLKMECHFPFGNKEDLNNIRKDIIRRRKEKQPLNYPNCGSVFKRGEGYYAGTLIEECGLKGYKVGGAEVSEKHGNFILNRDGASAEDIRKCIYHIQKTVYEKSKILLQPEVIFIGQFDTPLFTP